MGIRVPRRARAAGLKNSGEEQLGRDCEFRELATWSEARIRYSKSRDGQSQHEQMCNKDDDGGITNIRRDLILQRGCSE